MSAEKKKLATSQIIALSFILVLVGVVVAGALTGFGR
jgi:hypothetical protein